MEQSGDSGSHSETGPSENEGDPEEIVVSRRNMCALSACQVVMVVLATLMAGFAVAMLAGGYHALLNDVLQQVRTSVTLCMYV